jgi:hypothetical protein
MLQTNAVLLIRSLEPISGGRGSVQRSLAEQRRVHCHRSGLRIVLRAGPSSEHDLGAVPLRADAQHRTAAGTPTRSTSHIPSLQPDPAGYERQYPHFSVLWCRKATIAPCISGERSAGPRSPVQAQAGDFVGQPPSSSRFLLGSRILCGGHRSHRAGARWSSTHVETSRACSLSSGRNSSTGFIWAVCGRRLGP